MANLPKNPDALDNIFTDPDTPSDSLTYKIINGVTVNWAGGLPTDADTGQVYYEYGPFPNGLKIRFYQYGSLWPLRYDFTSCTEKLAVAEQKLIGTIPVTISDGVNDTASTVAIWLDGLATAPAPTSVGTTAASIPDTTAVSDVIAVLTADQPGCTFSEIADAANVFTVAADGTVTLSATVSTGSSPYYLTVRATNSGGTFDQVITVTVTSASDLVADSTVATGTALTSLLASWESNWAGTVPAGKTAADRRCVQLTAPITGNLTLNDYDYPQEVTVRSVGPYTDGAAWPWKPVSGSDISGTLTVTNCTNIRIWGMISARLAWTGNTDSIYERSFYMEAVTAGTPPTVAGPIVTGTRCTFKDAGGAYFKDQVLGYTTLTDFTFEGVVLDFVGNDAFKSVGGNTLRTTASRMWWGRNWYLGAGAHGDPYQAHSGTHDDNIFWGNVLLLGENPNNVALNGAFFTSNTAVFNNLSHEQNIYVTDGQWAARMTAGSGNVNKFNTALYGNQGAVGSGQFGLTPIISGAWATNESNIVVTKSAPTNSGEGTDGREIVIGSVQSGAIPSYTTYLATFAAVPTRTGDISQIKPLVGTDAHWDTVGTQRGATLRAKEIWVDKNVPGQVGWPLAGYWHKHWDPSNTVGTTWTGSYSADGANI